MELPTNNTRGLDASGSFFHQKSLHSISSRVIFWETHPPIKREKKSKIFKILFLIFSGKELFLNLFFRFRFEFHFYFSRAGKRFPAHLGNGSFWNRHDHIHYNVVIHQHPSLADGEAMVNRAIFCFISGYNYAPINFRLFIISCTLIVFY